MIRPSFSLAKSICFRAIERRPLLQAPYLTILQNPSRIIAADVVLPRWQRRYYSPTEVESGTSTPGPEGENEAQGSSSGSHFYFEAGYALFAKRRSRPFPPPFLSRPSNSFSDPLSTHNRSRFRPRDTEESYEGEMIRGVTNGDDAVLANEHIIAANDGVGQWAQKERGHAALWARLIIHFWALEAERDSFGAGSEPDAKGYLQRAYELTQEATSNPNEWYGTTTASGALITSTGGSSPTPVLYVTQLGDSKVLVLRPSSSEVIFRTEEQWHWFDCPRQLGTNSPDTPNENAVVDKIEILEGDVILALSDGVTDNLWEHEIVEAVVESMKKNESSFSDEADSEKMSLGMKAVASDLVKAAQVIATDPFAESPFMERAIDEGLPTEGGKLDDISVVAAVCKRRKS